tara:strand:+ start:464 stop:1081 length:618 start_codon:yes stop_codon:yes gene_type:complete
MGRSNGKLFPIYAKKIKQQQPVALLGFTNKPPFIKSGDFDCYDLQLKNFNINEDMRLKRKYKSIVCTRTLYFCRDPLKFLTQCRDFLLPGGEIFIDFGLGNHWTKFENFKVGWVKGGEHEWEYEEKNFLQSCIWDDSFLENKQVKIFQERIKKYGYNNLKQAVREEVPSLLELTKLKELFDVKLDFLTLWEKPQLYIFINLVPKN